MELSEESRHGRSLQVWNEDGAREVSVCIPIDLNTKQVLLVSSRSSPDRWILPKGGWESDETKQRSAEREAWEEAGVVGEIVNEIGVWNTFSKKKPDKAKAQFTVFEMKVTKSHDTWPEQSFRKRQWFDLEEAQKVVKHAWMVEAIQRCSIVKAQV
ncbi:NUDIX hydrolase domain-like protein [Syncephalis plumigaleata]|nr:NUDIX hydrolase domain-like protein [Syncephalis plumigaleata]